MPDQPADPASAAALELVADHHHVHLISDDMTRCVSGHCEGTPTLLRDTV